MAVVSNMISRKSVLLSFEKFFSTYLQNWNDSKIRYNYQFVGVVGAGAGGRGVIHKLTLNLFGSNVRIISNSNF